METARRFQDLLAWQVSSELSDLIYEVTETGRCLQDEEFREQIRRAAQKAPPLIAEGFIRYTDGELVKYLRMARGELGEVESRLLHAEERRYFTPEQQARLSELADRAMALTTALLKSKLPGQKQKPKNPRHKGPPTSK